LPNQSLIVTFCNQTLTASARHSALRLCREGQNASWLALADQDGADLHSDGMAGACWLGADIVLVQQAATQGTIVLYDPRENQVKSARSLVPCKDPHSVAYFEGSLYVVSTGTNELYRIPVTDGKLGQPEVYWQYPGVPYDRDIVHLNGVASSPEGLILSCFGPKVENGTWGRDGSVFMLDPYRLIANGLNQPHTPFYSNGRVFLAESGAGRVHAWEVRAGEWTPERTIVVSGYIRGIVCDKDVLWVGVSAKRAISRSKRTVNPGICLNDGAKILALAATTREVLWTIDLSGLGEEIYDILVLEGTVSLPRYEVSLRERLVGVREMLVTLRTRQAALEEANASLRADVESLVFENKSVIAYAAEIDKVLSAAVASPFWRVWRFFCPQLRRAIAISNQHFISH
jgi:hypothetical protein